MIKYTLILSCLLFPIIVSAGAVIFSKDLGSGIVMEQTDSKTFIKLKWKILKSYSNKSKSVPFIWNEWCSLYTEKLLKLSNNNWDQRQIIWDSLWEKWQRQCIRERYQKSIQIIAITGTTRFVTLRQVWYEWFITMLIDLKNSTTQDIGDSDVEKVITGKSGVYMQVNSSKWDCHGDIYLVNSSGKFILQFSMCKVAKDTDTAIVDSFELLMNQRFQVTYMFNDKAFTKIYPIQTK